MVKQAAVDRRTAHRRGSTHRHSRRGEAAGRDREEHATRSRSTHTQAQSGRPRAEGSIRQKTKWADISSRRTDNSRANRAQTNTDRHSRQEQ